ncbi:MAG: TraR/DksA C4-type zinc finger protein [Minwuia sp.]|nr:TraR/DksA C4-type zinc finger protein [Minwuia sp.]
MLAIRDQERGVPENIEELRAALLHRRDSLTGLSALSASSRDAVELDQSRVGRLSRMDALQQQEMAKASESQRTQQVARIDAALARIASGDFGYCLDCGEEIAAKRLAVDPATPLCIDCASGR